MYFQKTKKKCRKELTQSDIKEDTEEFFKSLDKSESETDIFGYKI